jgi:hypothetical protein
MHESNTKTTSAFSLLALLLAAAAFKDELKGLYLPLPHVSLLSVVVVIIILVSALLVLYLIIDLKAGTVLEKRLDTDRLKLVLDHAFLFLVILLIFLVLAEVIIQLLNLTIGYQQVSLLLSSIAMGVIVGIRTIIDKRQYEKYLNTLSEKERLIKLKIMSARSYLSTINSPRLRLDIESDISRFEKELSNIASQASEKDLK